MSEINAHQNGDYDEEDLVNQFERTRLANIMDKNSIFWKIGQFLILIDEF